MLYYLYTGGVSTYKTTLMKQDPVDMSWVHNKNIEQ